jgi:DNA gyrase subunit B
MTDLVRGGKIYIAQPPLYKIKRKKREEYVDDEAALNRILVTLGAEEVKLKNFADGKEFNTAQLKDILTCSSGWRSSASRSGGTGGDFEQFLTSAMMAKASCQHIW